FTHRLFGRVSIRNHRLATFATVDVPYAAVRRHVAANEGPPRYRRSSDRPSVIESIGAWAGFQNSGSQSGLKDCQFDLTKARGIGNDVDLDDFSAPDLEIEHDQQSSARRHDDSNGPVDERHLREFRAL